MNSVDVTIGAVTGVMGSSIMDDTLSEPSTPESPFDESDILARSHVDEVTAQLVAAGPVGIAAAAAIQTSRKRKRPHSFETNPSIRKRQQTRLLRKLKHTIEEYTTRVGQQAVVLSVTPGKSNHSMQHYKVFGSQPLENVVRNQKTNITSELDAALAAQAPHITTDTSGLHELPPLVVDGLPTSIDKMTQAQLRAFIPEMLKYSTGRSKPGWGKNDYRPIWWPVDVPWANVRSDVRLDEDKRRVSWTHALRTIVRNCYQHHGRDDLLPDFEDKNITLEPPTLVQTISNPDGTVSIIQISSNDLVTLPDGTHAQILHALSSAAGESHTVQTLSHTDLASHLDAQGMVSLAEASVHDGELVLSNDGATSISGVVTIPVSMYQNLSLDSSRLNVSINKVIKCEVPDATQAVEVMTAQQK